MSVPVLVGVGVTVVASVQQVENPVFLESDFNYRSWVGAVAVLALIGVGVWMIHATVADILNRPPALADLFPGLLIVIVWLLFAFVPSLYLGWRMLCKPSIKTRIDGAGITIDGHLHPWERVKWIWGKRENGLFRKRITLWFQDQGLLGLDQMVPLREGLTQEEYENLMEELGDYLGEHFPQVEIG